MVKAALSGTQFHLLHFVVPPDANITGLFYIRLRLSVDSFAVTVPYMAAPRGETEDYVWESVGILPVELLSFTGAPEGGRVRLQWSTATEQRTSHFVIERSADAMHYGPVGMLPAAGNSTGTLNYLLYDEHPHHGLNYYRLVQVDIDGRTERFGPIVVEHSGGAGAWAEVLPGEGVVVHGVGTARIQVYDHTGRQVAAGSMVHGRWSFNEVMSGVCLVVLEGPAGVETLRFAVP